MNKCNIENRTIYCSDNIDILKGINSNCIDLIYLDPPFNKNKVFTAPIGSSARGASFKDIFREEDLKDEWVDSIKEDYDGIYEFLNSVKNLSSVGNKKKNNHYLSNYSYLCFMAIRLIEMQRILKDTGSIYLHCDHTMSHYLKILLDLIFGEKNFRNEIVWDRMSGSKGNTKNKYPTTKDVLLFYSKDFNNVFFSNIYTSLNQDYIKKFYKYKDEKGDIYRKAGGGRPPHYKYYLKNSKGVPLNDLWANIKNVQGRSKERTGYKTQKPLALLERIIRASSNEGDVVLDPFCGCATTCVASEKLGRQWVGIDVSKDAHRLVNERIERELEKVVDYGVFAKNPQKTNALNIPMDVDPPKRTDLNGDDRIERKYVYIMTDPEHEKVKLYKIGIAKDIKSRLSSYNSGRALRDCNYKFTLLREHFRETEKYIHEKYDNIGEWVTGNLEEIIADIENFKNDKKN